MNKVFVWDWKDTAPIADIIKSIKSVKGSNLYSINAGDSDSSIAVVAKNKKEAKKIYLAWGKSEYSKLDYEYFLEDTENMRIEIWQD